MHMPYGQNERTSMKDRFYAIDPWTFGQGSRVTIANDFQRGKYQRIGFTESTLTMGDTSIHPCMQLHGLSTRYEQWDPEEMAHSLGATVAAGLY